MSDWAKILEAVREPISLAALSLLIVMVVLRQVLTRVSPVAGRSAYRLALSVVTVVGVLSFVVASGAIGYKFYELRTRSSYQIARLQTESNLELSKLAAAQAGPPLTRLDMENVVQKHRSSIEECLRHQKKTLYLDFLIQSQQDGQLNVDILNGRAIGFQVAHPLSLDSGITSEDLSRVTNTPRADAYFVSGDRTDFPRVTATSAKKLSATVKHQGSDGEAPEKQPRSQEGERERKVGKGMKNFPRKYQSVNADNSRRVCPLPGSLLPCPIIRLRS
jgi:hypothetical protein